MKHSLITAASLAGIRQKAGTPRGYLKILVRIAPVVGLTNMGRTNKYQFPFAKYPAVRLALLLSSGIVMDHYTGLELWVWLLLLLLAIAGYGTGEHYTRHRVHRSVYAASLLCYLLGILIFGGFWHSVQNNKPDHPATVLEAYHWEELIFRGEVNRIQKTSSDKYQIDLSIDSTHFDALIPWTEKYKLRTILDPDDIAMPDELALGDRLAIEATLYPLEGKRNPHEFDYKNYLASIDIYAQAGVQSIISYSKSQHKLSWNYIRQQVLTAIDNNFSRGTRPLAKALLIGYKNELEREEKIAFSRAGLSHIMAVSGLHVGFILAPFWLIVPFFWTFRYGKQIGMVLLLFLLLFYAGLTGFSASVTRASLVGGFLMYGRLFHKVRDSKNLTALAALIILLVNPNDLFDIGFQLSFTAVYIILLTTPVISSYLPPWIRFRWYGAPVMIVIISILVQAGLYPLLIYYFGEFSIAGPLANAVVVPFLTFAVPVALALLPVAFFYPSLSQILNRPIQLFLENLNTFVEWISALQWSWIQTNLTSPVLFLIWLAILFAVATWNIHRLRWKYICLLLAVLCLHQTQILVETLSAPKLKITILDVGQGDAALVSTPNGKHFLVDTGRWSPGYNSAKYVIIPHLEAEGITRLDAIFHSHPHADHIGGTPELLDHIPVDIIYNSGASYDSNLYRNYLLKAQQKSIPVKSLRAGDIVDLDPAIKIFVYGPDDTACSANVNNSSVVLELIYGSTEFLFTGDAERSQEEKLVTHYPHLADTDFLKVGHHGSKTSSNSSFLSVTTPEIASVSLAKSNRFRHPNPEAVQRLRQSDASLFFTSLEGALQFESDGTKIRKIDWK